MPRPEMTVEYFSNLQARAELVIQNPPPGIPAGLISSPEIRAIVMDVFMSSDWLSDELKKVGASDDECERICFAHGQRCFANPVLEPTW